MMCWQNSMKAIRCCLVAVLMCGSGASLADNASLRVSIEGGAFNSKFKFFDASAGCPSTTIYRAQNSFWGA